MNKKTKKRMLMLSFVFLVLGATATWASNDVLKVQSILGTAIQDIQKIYFSSGAVKDPAHPETEILMNLQNGSVHMGGRMMMAISGANDRMGKLSTGSSLFQGRNNTISGANSFLVGGSGNTIEQDASGSAILGGTSNKIIKGIASYILGGNKNTISGDNSFIIGGVNNKIEGNNSYIFGFTGVKINANNSVAFGKNIEIEKDNVFMWNGTTNKESASRENTFVMYAKNGLIIKDASNITVTKNNSTGALNVADGIMQISGEAVHCGPAIQGAIQYTGGAFGCFCGCNGTGWVSMTPTQKCRNLCPTIDGFSWDGALCKYSESDERDSLTKAEACEAGNSSDIEDVTSSYFGEDYVSGWQWTCEDSLGGDTVSCSTKRKLVKGRCGSTLNSCAGEGVLDTTSIRFVNHKNIRECLPVGYPVYWVEGGGETNTKQICSLCEDGYKNLKDASGNWIKDSDGSIKCFKIEGTSCKNDETITTDWNVGCTSGGVAKSTSTDANGNKTWNCESPTGEAGEKFCHTCNASANYVWSGGTTNKCVLKKKGQCGEKAQFASNNKNTWCKVGSVEVVTENSSTQSYAWYCKGENAGDEAVFKSDLCTWCPTGKTYNVDSGKCESEEVDYCGTKGVHHVGNNYIVSNGTQCMTIADKNVGASSLGGVGGYYTWGSKSPSSTYPVKPDSYDCESPFLNCLWGEGGWPSPCGDGYTVPSKQDWELLHKLWSESDSSLSFDSAFSLPLAGYYEDNTKKQNGVGYYWSNNALNPGSCGGVKLNPWTVYKGTDSVNGMDGENWGVQVRCFGEGDHTTPPPAEKEDGVCSSTYYKCEKGYPSNTGFNSSTFIYSWKCNSTNGGQTVDCQSGVVFNGVCAPSPYGCQGPMNAINTGYNSLTKTYTWTCPGINGGNGIDCTAVPQNGECSETRYKCNKGIVSEKHSPEDGTLGYTWVCKGVAGGNDVQCGVKWFCPYVDYCTSTDFASTFEQRAACQTLYGGIDSWNNDCHARTKSTCGNAVGPKGPCCSWFKYPVLCWKNGGASSSEDQLQKCNSIASLKPSNCDESHM